MAADPAISSTIESSSAATHLRSRPDASRTSTNGFARLPRSRSRSLPHRPHLPSPSPREAKSESSPSAPRCVDDLHLWLRNEPDVDYAVIYFAEGELCGSHTKGFPTRFLPKALRGSGSRSQKDHNSGAVGTRGEVGASGGRCLEDHHTTYARCKTVYTSRSASSGGFQEENPGSPMLATSASGDIEERSDMASEEMDEASESVQICVGDEKAVRNFYEERFKHLQQIPCKSIAKDWIKAIEPKKQAQFPYNGGKGGREPGSAEDVSSNKGAGDKTRPPWWPTDGCPHREPDHIHKEQRLTLLMHLLRNLWKPEERPDKRQYWQKFDANELEKSTEKTAKAWRHQAKYESNEIWLNDIYKMRRFEQRYIEGGVDATARHTFRALPEPRREQRKSKRSPQREMAEQTNDFTPRELRIETNHRAMTSNSGSFLSHMGEPHASPIVSPGTYSSQGTTPNAQMLRSMEYRPEGRDPLPNIYHGPSHPAQPLTYPPTFPNGATSLRTSHPVAPRSPARKRSVDTMNGAAHVAEVMPASHGIVGLPSAYSAGYQPRPFFRDGSGGNNALAFDPMQSAFPSNHPMPANGRHTEPGPGQSRTRPPEPSTDPRHYPPQPGVRENNSGSAVGQWGYPPMAIQTHHPYHIPTQQQWQGSYHAGYVAAPVPQAQAQPPNPVNAMQNMQIQQQVPTAFPYFAPQEYPMTANGWDGYTA